MIKLMGENISFKYRHLWGKELLARPLRIEYEGAFYHIISRGERQENIFRARKDREKFLQKLNEISDKHLVRIHSYVLMSNHYHLILETPQMNLTNAMHDLNSSYSNWYKAKYEIIGSVFQGRYKSPLIEKESYLTVLSAYIHLNPVRAGIVASPGEFYWSSYPSYLGMVDNPDCLCTSLILEEFGNNRGQYEEFVLNWENRKQAEFNKAQIKNQPILGSTEFIDSIKTKLKRSLISMDQREIPAIKALVQLDQQDISKIVQKTFHLTEKDCLSKKKGNLYRKLFVYGLKRYTNMRLNEIGDIIDVNYTAVSELVRRFLADCMTDKNKREKREQFERAIAEYKMSGVKISPNVENEDLTPN